MGMALQMKPGYVNPLTMKSPNKFTVGKHALPESQDKGKIKFKDLKIRQQQLQNELLLIKATGSDSGGDAVEKVKKMEDKLADVNVDLRSAKMEGTDKDTYEPGRSSKESLGIYGRDGKFVY